MRDSVLGRKKHIVKESDPLDPTYVMKSPSGRRMMQIGEIDKSKPTVLIQQVVKKDNHRHLRTEDIQGASPKVHSVKRIQEIDEAEKRHFSNRVNEQLLAIKEGQVVPNYYRRKALARFVLEGTLTR